MPTTKNAASVKTVPSRRRFLQTSLAGGVGAAMLPALAGAREMAAYVRQLLPRFAIPNSMSLPSRISKLGCSPENLPPVP